MNKNIFIMVFTVVAAIFFITCEKFISSESSYIEGLTIDNYPRMDGSTSTYPLNVIIACALFDIDYKWVQWSNGIWNVEPQIKGNFKKKFDKQVKSNQTHGSFINLITKDTDIILTARTMSGDEIIYAQEAGGIKLTETPIALDALIFIVNPNNSIESLTIKQIQDIYTGEVTHWYEVGGDLKDSIWYQIDENSWGSKYEPAPIHPYLRNSNSGSQELMDSLVMKYLEYSDHLGTSDEVVIESMSGAHEMVSTDIRSICYTIYYYKEYMIKKENFTKTIAVDGIFPNEETIGSSSYPFTAEVYAVIRSDTDKSSMTYKVYEWLLTPAGKQVISESGYIPY